MGSIKRLIAIVFVGGVLFSLVSIAQDWRNFFRLTPNAATTKTPETTRPIEGAVRQFITMVGHAQRSAGDPRFVERIPGSDEVIAEVAGEIDYLEKNGRVQVGSLQELEVLDVELVTPTRAVVRTHERWLAHTASAKDGRALEPGRMHDMFVEYRLEQRGPRWIVVSWQHTTPPAPDDDAGSE